MLGGSVSACGDCSWAGGDGYARSLVARTTRLDPGADAGLGARRRAVLDARRGQRTGQPLGNVVGTCLQERTTCRAGSCLGATAS